MHRSQKAPKMATKSSKQQKTKKATKNLTKKSPLQHTKRNFSNTLDENGREIEPGQFTTRPDTVSNRKSIPYKQRNPHAGEEPVEEDREKIDGFLEKLGLSSYKDKFTSFDGVIMTNTHVLKTEFGMNVKERKLLRKHANYFRVSHYYKTGEIWQPKYEYRRPYSPNRMHRDLTSEDEMTFTLPAKDGLYRTFLRYPGSSYKENFLMRTYADDRFFVKQDPDAKLTPEQIQGATEIFHKFDLPLPTYVKSNTAPVDSETESGV